MSATAQPPVAAAPSAGRPPLGRAEGLELLGEVHGSGYKEGAALVRRADGQMVHLGPLMYGLLACVDGRRGVDELAAALSEQLGRGVEPEHVVRLAEKLGEQGLLAGTEQHAPPRSNPLLALRWKVLLTNPAWTERLTRPFLFLFRPWAMWPILVAFLGVFWFVLIHKGVASATAQVFDSPELLLLVFVLAVASAAFHEIGHASACRYGGARPAGMGAGIYMVWPAFYTDVTDAYRLPRRGRLRVDLGGLFFNTIVAVVTLGVWLVVRVDALLLLIALQLLQMVQQLSPIIRADGYHILADATGVPDLYAHIGPTLRRLLPWRRNEPSALKGRARLFVTLWVLIIVPVLLSLTISALLVFPRLVASAWEGGRQIVEAIPQDAGDGRIFDVLVGVLRLFALLLPVVGVTLMSQRLGRRVTAGARSWSAGSPPRRAVVMVAAMALLAAAAWAWWPAGQYQPVRPDEGGTLVSLARSVTAPASAVRPPAPAPTAQLSPGKHLAVALIPQGGATKEHPAVYVIKSGDGEAATVVASDVTPEIAQQPSPTTAAPGAATASPATTPPEPAANVASTATPTVPATAFPFVLPSKPGPGDTQALAVNTEDGSIKYTVAYALVTVRDGAAADNANSAFAFASCRACSTVAVSFQVVLVVGQTKSIAPINVAGALNVNCPACITTAIADQIVVTLDAEPSDALLAQLQADLDQLGALPALGLQGTPEQIATQVLAVHQQIQAALQQSGQLASQSEPAATAPTTTSAAPATTTTTTSTTTTSTTPETTTTTSTTPETTTTAEPETTTTPSTTSTTSTTPTSTTPAETSTTSTTPEPTTTTP
ncbi:MAG: Tat (Twin-arginine translocation) pathway signal sequence domain protein [Acidimicrobiales bacterium]|nr:Tat (Twin-arginine translocation) pathway signal sequence domain protein [Acidimicrobiales bacterium]